MSDDLERFHQAIDDEVRGLEAVHLGRLQCRKGCSSCCVDGLTVFEAEAEAIRRNHAELLETGAPHATGACAFLDETGACRIYRDRPYVCRSQGVPLRWLDESEDGEIVEQRDICELNDQPEGKSWPLITDLSPRDCWTIGPTEAKLQEMQREFARSRGSSETQGRVELRRLFRRA